GGGRTSATLAAGKAAMCGTGIAILDQIVGATVASATAATKEMCEIGSLVTRGSGRMTDIETVAMSEVETGIVTRRGTTQGAPRCQELMRQTRRASPRLRSLQRLCKVSSRSWTKARMQGRSEQRRTP
ncbi:unnamed protein product, partial [Effrenium voratum]